MATVKQPAVEDAATGRPAVRRAAVIGTGTMGPGMGAVLARAGIAVAMYDVSEEALDRSKAGVGLAEGVLDQLDTPQVDGGSIRYTADLAGNTTNLIAAGVLEGAKSVFRFSNDGQSLVYVAMLALTNQVYLYDFLNGTTTLISHNYNSSSAAYGESDSPAISANGRFIAYRSGAVDLVPGHTNGLPEIILYDRQTGLNTFLTTSQSGNFTANNRSFSPVFTPDGTMLFFGSWASDLVPGDFNHSADLFSYGLLYVLTLPSNIGTQGPWLSWPWDSNRNYGVQYKQGLTDTTWHDLGATITNNGLKAYVHDLAPAASQRFYRVVSF